MSELGGICPHEIERPVMRQRWEQLTFVHWRFAVADVQRLLPNGLHVETFDGSAWVGLIPFFMRVGTPRGRTAPWISNFCETNVRTYVRDDHGRSGIWFFSLEAARLGAVVAARGGYRLPYMWAAMSIAEDGQRVRYQSRRRLPGPHGASSLMCIEVGEVWAPSELTERDHFLTARWMLFSAGLRGQRVARVSHEPWPLHRAKILELDDQLVEAAGLPTPTGEPLVHYSPGVEVLIGLPERVR